MSVEKINDKVDAFYSTNKHDVNVLDELDPLFKDSFKSDAKGAINAENIAIKVSKKNTSKSLGSQSLDHHGENSSEVSKKNTSKSLGSQSLDHHGENSSEISQEQFNGVGQKQVKKGEGVIEFFGSLAKGVFGSSKKQKEELRRLEQEVQLLNEQRHGLTSEIKKNMFDSMAIESGITNMDGSHNEMYTDVSRSNHANRENNQIDDRAKLNMKKDEKLARISELRKKGV